MDIYVIPPVNNLELMNKGDRFFCLAQLYMKYPHYREFFKQKVADGKWVTLDNGAGDHDIVSLYDLLKVVADLQPSEVIPPDHLFDGRKTIREFHTFILSIAKIQALRSPAKSIEIFACPQGESKEEWLFAYRYFLEHPAVSTIGFSKIAVPKAFLNLSGDKGILESRWMAYDELKAKGLIQKPIHCLGAGDVREFKYYKEDPLMRSTDSCVSIWSAMNGIEYNQGNFERVPTPKDYFERNMTPLQYTVAEENIEFLKSIVNS